MLSAGGACQAGGTSEPSAVGGWLGCDESAPGRARGLSGQRQGRKALRFLMIVPSPGVHWTSPGSTRFLETILETPRTAPGDGSALAGLSRPTRPRRRASTGRLNQSWIRRASFREQGDGAC